MERIVICRVGTGISDPRCSCFVLLDHFLRVHKLGRNGEGKFEYVCRYLGVTRLDSWYTITIQAPA